MAYPKSGTRDPGPGTQLIGGTRDPKGGTRDSRPGTQPRGWIREPRPETLKVGLETQDRGPWKWIFDKCSQISLKPGVYKRIHLLYAFMSIFYVSHYTIIKHIHFQSFITLMSYSFPVFSHTAVMKSLNFRQNQW